MQGALRVSRELSAVSYQPSGAQGRATFAGALRLGFGQAAMLFVLGWFALSWAAAPSQGAALPGESPTSSTATSVLSPGRVAFGDSPQSSPGGSGRPAVVLGPQADSSGPAISIQAAAIPVLPTAGPPGTIVAVTGSLFSPSAHIHFHLDSTSNPIIGMVTAKGDGSFLATFPVPLGASAGSHNILTNVGGATVAFTVQSDCAPVLTCAANLPLNAPALTLNPNAGVPGGEVIGSGSGFGANGTGTASLQVFWKDPHEATTTNPASPAAGAGGAFTGLEITIPLSAPALGGSGGNHIAVVLDAVNGRAASARAYAAAVPVALRVSPAAAVVAEDAETEVSITINSDIQKIEGAEVALSFDATLVTVLPGVTHIALSPNQGPVGTTVTVSGYAFTPSQQVCFTYGAAALAGLPCVTLGSDAKGRFSATFAVPAGTLGIDMTVQAYRGTVGNPTENALATFRLRADVGTVATDVPIKPGNCSTGPLPTLLHNSASNAGAPFPGRIHFALGMLLPPQTNPPTAAVPLVVNCTLAVVTFQGKAEGGPAPLTFTLTHGPLPVTHAVFEEVLLPLDAVGGTVQVTPAPDAEVRLEVPMRRAPRNADVKFALKTTIVPGHNLGAWTIRVGYDPAVVTVTACTARHSGLCNPTFGPGTLEVTRTLSTGLTGTQTLADITFVASSAVGTSSPLPVTITTFTNDGGSALFVAPVGGEILVGVPYDVNGSGSLTTADVTCLRRKVATFPVIPACPATSEFDVNFSGAITSADVVCMRRRIASFNPIAACPAFTLALQPASGLAGSNIAATASAFFFPDNTTVEFRLDLDGVAGPLLTSAPVAANKTVSASFAIPVGTSVGVYSVKAVVIVGATPSVVDSAVFTVTP